MLNHRLPVKLGKLRQWNISSMTVIWIPMTKIMQVSNLIACR